MQRSHLHLYHEMLNHKIDRFARSLDVTGARTRAREEEHSARIRRARHKRHEFSQKLDDAFDRGAIEAYFKVRPPMFSMERPPPIGESEALNAACREGVGELPDALEYAPANSEAPTNSKAPARKAKRRTKLRAVGGNAASVASPDEYWYHVAGHTKCGAYRQAVAALKDRGLLFEGDSGPRPRDKHARMAAYKQALPALRSWVRYDGVSSAHNTSPFVWREDATGEGREFIGGWSELSDNLRLEQ